MFSQNAKVEAFVASGDLSGMLNRVVKFVGDLTVGAGTAGAGFGVLQNAPKAGEHAAVATDGVTMVRVGAAVTAGDFLTSAASGWAITATSTIQVGSGSYLYQVEILGKAETGAASGMLAAVNLKQFTRAGTVA